MRVITKEYPAMLDASETWNFIKNTPKPDFTELDKEVAKFEASNKAFGLEKYLKYQSIIDEENNNSRTYLVKDILTGEYSLPDEKLIKYYKKLGFTRLPAA